jgi:hypothetical protein
MAAGWSSDDLVHQAPGIEDRLRSVTLLAEAMQETVSPNGYRNRAFRVIQSGQEFV